MNLISYLLANVSNGFFVDVGANDGVCENRTIVLEHNNWNGICIEALDRNYNQLINNRQCTCCYEVVDYIDGRVVDFLEQQTDTRPMFGGSHIMNYDQSEHDHEYWDGLVEDASNAIIIRHGGKKTQRITKSLNTILSEQKAPHHIDYLKIDIEGFEYQALKTLNFDKYTIDFILTEGNISNSKNVKLLSDHGYSVIDHSNMDILFKHNSVDLNEKLTI